MTQVRMLLIFCVCTSILATLSGAEGNHQAIPLKGAYDAFAIDPATGAVAALDSESATVTLYPKAFFDGANVAPGEPVKTAGKGQKIVYKKYKDKGYFVVGCTDGTICIYDVKDLRPVKDIRLSRGETNSYDSGAVSITASLDANDPYVYYSGGFRRGNSLGRISLASMADDGPLNFTVEYSEQNSSDIVISANGNFLYATQRDSSPPGISSYLRTTDPETGKDSWSRSFFDSRATVGKFLPDPFGGYTAIDRRLCSLDLKTTLKPLDFDPACFFSSKPVIIGQNADKLAAYSYNTLKLLGEVSLAQAPVEKTQPSTLTATSASAPAGSLPRGRSARVVKPSGYSSSFREPQDTLRRQSNVGVKYIADDANLRVLVLSTDSAIVVPLKDFNFADEPLLTAKVQVPAKVYVGMQVVGSVEPGAKGITVSIKDGPKGLKLDGTKLSWTPKDEDAGTANVELAVSGGGISTSQYFSMNVAYHSIKLPFVASKITLSPSGKLALAWGSGQRGRRGSYSEQDTSTANLAIIDVAQMKVLAQKRLLYGIRAAAIDDQAVYVAPAESARLDTLSIKDLSSDKRVNLEAAIGSMEFIGPGKLLLGVASMSASKVVYSVPELRPMDLPLLARRGFDRMDRSIDTTASIEGNWLNGFMFSPDFASVRMMTPNQILPSMKYPVTKPPYLWNRYTNGRYLLSGQDRQIGELNCYRGRIFTEVPAVACLNDRQPSGERLGRVSLQVFDLVTGKLVQAFNLKERDAAQRSDYGDGSPVLITGRTMLALVDDEVYVVSLDDEACKNLTVPLVFELPQQIAVAGIQQPLKIPHKIRGGAAPLEFELGSTWEGLDVDKATGTVTIDGQAMSKAACTKIVEHVMQWRGSPEGNSPAKMIKALKADFKRITGKDAAGVPIQVPISLVASDKDGQTAKLDYVVILEVPDEMVLKTIEDLNKPVPPGSLPGRTRPEVKPPVTTQNW